MRNKLAEDVLNSEMLMECFQAHLGQETGQHLDASIKLLKHISILVLCFRDKRPIVDANDTRLQDIKTVGDYFNDWENTVSR